MPHRPVLLAALVTALAVAVPPPARAAEGFAGVLENGRLAHFASDTLGTMSTPRLIRGIAPREQLVALDTAGPKAYAIGSTARLYAIDLRHAVATRIGPAFPAGLRGRRFSLAASGDGRTADLISDVGQHLVVDLQTGAVADAPGLRSTDGSPVFPAVDRLGDGRLAGVDVPKRRVLTETAPGSNTFTSGPLSLQPTAADFGEPGGFDVDAADRTWALAGFGGNRFRPQSLVSPIVLATGEPANDIPRAFDRRVLTMTSTGAVPDDRRPARITVRLPRRGLSVRDLLTGVAPITVVSNEGGQATAWIRITRRSAGPGFDSRDVPGRYRIKYLRLAGDDRRVARQKVGRRVLLRIEFVDGAGNRTTVRRSVRLVR